MGRDGINIGAPLGDRLGSSPTPRWIKQVLENLVFKGNPKEWFLFEHNIMWTEELWKSRKKAV